MKRSKRQHPDSRKDPSIKIHAPEKIQTSRFKLQDYQGWRSERFWMLELEFSLEFGCWSLDLSSEGRHQNSRQSLRWKVSYN
jgi:hypothetical protein